MILLNTAFCDILFIGIIIVILGCFRLIYTYTINNRIEDRRRRIMNSNELISIKIDEPAEYQLFEQLDDMECSICLELLTDNMECCSIKCGHVFHTECIKEWSRIKQNCPLCRKSIL